jgi:Ca2+-binding RTX toxin-like protein
MIPNLSNRTIGHPDLDGIDDWDAIEGPGGAGPVLEAGPGPDRVWLVAPSVQDSWLAGGRIDRAAEGADINPSLHRDAVRGDLAGVRGAPSSTVPTGGEGLLAASGSQPLSASAFDNGDFETGTFSGWTLGGGVYSGGGFPNPAEYLPGGAKYNLASASLSVTSAGFDANTDGNLSLVFDGAHSARVNDASPNYGVSIISQRMDAFEGSEISFAFAAVLTAAHGPQDAAIFQISLTDATTGSVLYSLRLDGGTASNLFTTSAAGWKYTAWQTQTIDVSALAGHDFVLTMIVADCDAGGHTAYGYLDLFNQEPGGDIAGNLFHDRNTSLVRDPGEKAFEGWTVYLDRNNDGVRNGGEVVAVADSDGNYLFSNIRAGEVAVRVEAPLSWENWQAPAVTVTVVAETVVSGQDFAITGGASDLADTLVGIGATAEVIDGLGGNDLIVGKGGDDSLSGGAGDDVIRGWSGDDLVIGGRGNDRLSGGTGADEFMFGLNSDHDRVRDFSAAEGDIIRLDIAGIDSFDDLVFTQRGLDTLVSWGSASSDILFRGLDPSDLTAASFVFGPAAASDWHLAA